MSNRSNSPSAPVAAITEFRTYAGDLAYLLEVTCPHCGRTHTHGGGTDRYGRVSEIVGCSGSVCRRLLLPKPGCICQDRRLARTLGAVGGRRRGRADEHQEVRPSARRARFSSARRQWSRPLQPLRNRLAGRRRNGVVLSSNVSDVSDYSQTLHTRVTRESCGLSLTSLTLPGRNMFSLIHLVRSQRQIRTKRRPMSNRSNSPAAPLVAVTEAETYDGQQMYLLEVQCPHCSKIHTHGGGTDRATVGKYLGRRASHCGSSDGYILTDPGGLA